VVEAERALCERSETERPIGFLGLSVGRLLAAGFWPFLKHFSFFAPNVRRTRREDYLIFVICVIPTPFISVHSTL
jgi:hypothetical protein